MPVKLKEIATLAGVSQPVVSAVLNNTGGGVRVSKEKSRKIRALAEELGYIPNYAAQKLRGRHTPTIGIIGGGFQVPMQTVLISQLMRKFSEKGYFVLLNNNINNQNSMTDGHTAVRELLSRGIDGALLIGNYSQKTRKLLNLPCVILRNTSPGQYFDYNIDSQTGTFLAVKHLFKHGHKKIIITANTQALEDDRACGNTFKYSGAQEAFQEAGLSLDYLKLFGLVDDSENKDNQEELLRLIRDEAFTAIVCGNDFAASRIMSFLKSNGIKIPEDFAIIGYNGSAFTRFTSPPLTTVVQPLKLMATKAFELLLWRIEEGINGIACSKFEMIVPYLSVGGSCGCEIQPIDILGSSPETLTLE